MTDMVTGGDDDDDDVKSSPLRFMMNRLVLNVK